MKRTNHGAARLAALTLSVALMLGVVLTLALPAAAKDTDIYRPTVKPNVMIMFDNSGSMDWGVYEYKENYQSYYDYLSERTCNGGYEIRDAATGTGPGPSNAFYHQNVWTRNEVLLIGGNIGYALGADGKGYTGDPGDDGHTWSTSNIVHTGYTISNDGSSTIATDADGYVLYNGARLPNGQDVKLHDWATNADGTSIDRGLAGMLRAPGYYFSGYFMKANGDLTSDPALAQVVSGRKMVVLFVPGNWVSMRCVYNLYVVSGCTDGGTQAYKVRPDNSATFWQTAMYSLSSPSYPGNYPNRWSNVDTITQLGAASIRLHFTDFVTYNSSDKVRLYDGNNNLIATYYGNMGAFWAVEVPGNKVKVEFVTNNSGQAHGWKIDRYNYCAETTSYSIERRIDVAREAIIEVIDATMGRINWGLASFNYAGGNSGNGAKIESPLNPSFTDDQNRQNLLNHLNALEPGAGTPLCESAQDLYNYFAQHTNILRECTHNYVIYMTDGYPSADSDNHRLSTGVTLTNNPADGYTQDPYQYATPDPDLMDDATYYAYHHSVYDGSSIAQPASSYANVIAHCIGFSLDAPLLSNAAADGGGEYYVSYNKQQLVSAFYSLGLIIIQNAGYTAPVVSVDSANRTQSGDEVYMAFFKPMTVGLGYWGGNVKRYGIDLRTKGDCIPPRTQTEWVIVDYPGGAGASDATDCDGNFKDSSYSWWDSNALPDGDDVEKGGVGELIYNAVTLASPYTRPIYTYTTSFQQVLPTNGALTNTLFGVSTDDDRYKVINFVYGFTYAADATTHAPVAKRSWPLGDIIHSEPVIIDYCPSGQHNCATLTERYLVVGSNDGMLHVFDADLGTEVWSFLPPNLLPKLKNFDPASGVNQQDLVDGPLGLFDYKVGALWKKLLVVGERRGGRAYYAIDVTSPDTAAWTLQWSIVGGATAGFDDLGQTWSKPQMVKLGAAASGQINYALVFGGGYDEIEDQDNPGTNRTMGCALYVVDLITGALDYSYTAGNNAALKCVPADVTIITNAADNLSCFYFVDTTANVWKTTCTLTTGTPLWETHKVFAGNPGSTALSGNSGGTLNASDTGRKIFYPPDVSLGNTFTDYPVLYLGTGDREHPLETAVHNRIYCIIDSIPSGAGYAGQAALTECNLVNVTNDELQAGTSTTEAERNRIRTLLQNSNGYYIKLDSIGSGIHTGEKVLAQATVFYYVAYFTTFTPINVDDSCNPQGEAKVYALEYSTGTAGLDYNQNDVSETSDRYRVIGTSIPSRVKIIIRSGTAAGLISVGGKVTGAGEGGSTRLPQPGSAIETILWRELGPADVARSIGGLPYGRFAQ